MQTEIDSVGAMPVECRRCGNQSNHSTALPVLVTGRSAFNVALLRIRS
jgi:hypothetical protein